MEIVNFRYLIKQITLVIIIVQLIVSCTSKDSTFFIVKGEIKDYNGTIRLVNAVNSNYYNDNFKITNIDVIDGKFEIKIPKSKNIPLPFFIETPTTKTNQFIIEEKNQKINIDSLYYNVNPIIVSKNSSIKNDQKKLDSLLKPMILKFGTEYKKINTNNYHKDSIEKKKIFLRKTLIQQTNKTLLHFSKENSDSYVVFWKIATSLMYNGYSLELEKVYNNFSEKTKQSKQGKELKKIFSKLKTLLKNEYFPILNLKNTDGDKIIFKSKDFSKSKYILLDFWFSNCNPCISQFPKLKKLEKEYPELITIIGISTDKTSKIENWKKVLTNYEISWLNLLDENGAVSASLGINKFPTNFLLDSEGKILSRDYPISDLEQKLENGLGLQ